MLDDLGVSTLAKVEDSLTNPGRIYDALGKSGTFYEVKNFTHYFGKNRDTIIQQFTKDVNGLDEKVFLDGKLKWYFRGPRDAKRGAEDIVNEMQKILDKRFKGKYSIESIIKFQGKRVPY